MCKNNQIIEKFKEMVGDLYLEPDDSSVFSFPLKLLNCMRKIFAIV